MHRNHDFASSETVDGLFGFNLLAQLCKSQEVPLTLLIGELDIERRVSKVDVKHLLSDGRLPASSQLELIDLNIDPIKSDDWYWRSLTYLTFWSSSSQEYLAIFFAGFSFF